MVQASVVAAVGQLLGRALRACVACPTPGCKACVELSQDESSPNTLHVRVSDDGLHIPEEAEVVLATFVDLGQLLSAPCWRQTQLRVRTAGLEEAVIRSYALGALPGHPALQLLGQQVQPQLANRHVCGTECSLSAGLGQVPAGLVVDSVQQLLTAVAALAPAVQLTLRLRGVRVQLEGGSEERVDWSGRCDARLPPELPPLQRMHASLVSLFRGELPPAGEQGRAEGGAAAASEAAAAAPGGPAAAEAAAAAAGPGAEPMLLTHVGVGEAGLGCEAAALRGCRWTARAGVVLQLPDHAAQQQAQQTQQAQQAQLTQQDRQAQQAQLTQQDRQAGGQGRPQQQQGGGAVAAPPAGSAEAGLATTQGTPVYVFRDHALDLGDLSLATRGLTRCEWASFGFALEGLQAAEAPGAGPMQAALRCAQPLSQACIAGVLVHLQPGDAAHSVQSGRALPLAPTHEARLVRLAVEGALRHLREQAPGVVAGRRERSLMRSLPALQEAVSGIVAQSQASDLPLRGAGLAALACEALGCEAGGFGAALEAALHATLQAARVT